MRAPGTAARAERRWHVGSPPFRYRSVEDLNKHLHQRRQSEPFRPFPWSLVKRREARGTQGAKRSERWGIERADGTALGLCGVWERWKSPAGEEVTSCATFTINCDEHPLLKRFHKHFDGNGESNERRTPALLREKGYDRWLDALVDEAPSFFTPFGSDDLQAAAALATPPRQAPSVPHPHPQQELLLR